MVHQFLRPEWFMGYDMLLEVMFAIILLLVAWYSFKSYKLTNSNSLKLFGFGFLFMSFAYFMLFLSNVAGFYALSSVDASPAMRIMDYIHFNLLGLNLYILLFSAGLMTLTYMTLNNKSEKLYALLMIPMLLALGLSANRFFLFHLICVFLMLIVVIHYRSCYKKTKKQSSLITFVAFSLLLFGKIIFIFSGDYFEFYVAGHLIEFGAYLLILLSFIKVLRK